MSKIDKDAVERVKTYLDARRKLLPSDGDHIHGIGNGKGGVIGLNAPDIAALLAAKETAEAELAALREFVQAIADMECEPVGLADIARATLATLDRAEDA